MPNPSVYEADMAERRTRLAGTIDEIVTRLTPSNIIKAETDKAKQKFAEVTQTPEGKVKVEVVAAAAAVVVAAVAYKAWRHWRS